MYTCGIVLSGGKSSRMGTNKSLLPVQGKKAIVRVIEKLEKCSDQVYVITNNPSEYAFLNYEMFSDRFIDHGPLAGIETALYHIEADAYVFAACDMPFISNKVYDYLRSLIKDYEAVVPVYQGREHPLSGIYRRSVLPHIQRHLKAKNLRVNSFFDDVSIKRVQEFPNFSKELLEKHFFNMNNPKQYEEAKRL